MDMRLVIAAQGLAGITATECGVLVALATCRDHRTGICNPLLDTVVALSHYKRRAVLYAIDSLRQKRLIETERKPEGRGGRTWYTFRIGAGYTGGVDNSTLGAVDNSALGATDAPRGCNRCTKKVQQMHQEGCNRCTHKDIYKDNTKVCVKDSTHTQDILKGCLQDLRGVVPAGYVRARLEDLERTAWTLPDGRRIAPEGFAAHVLAWWRNERERGKWLKSAMAAAQVAARAQGFTAKDWGLCAERCANYGGEGCACGVKIPPDRNEPRAFPPEECEHYAPRDVRGRDGAAA